jgi:hypothetical protein
MTDAEADVVLAAWELIEAEEGDHYGPNKSAVLVAHGALLNAINHLATEGEGQWTHPDARQG